jgi:hypothetical protein
MKPEKELNTGSLDHNAAFSIDASGHRAGHRSSPRDCGEQRRKNPVNQFFDPRCSRQRQNAT